MTKITKLEPKYLVFKWGDIQDLPSDIKEKVAFIQGYIETFRHAKGKKDNKYLVLNLDDDIDIKGVRKTIDEAILNVILSKHNGILKVVKVKDIAVSLVNAILKAKESK